MQTGFGQVELLSSKGNHAHTSACLAATHTTANSERLGTGHQRVRGWRPRGERAHGSA